MCKDCKTYPAAFDTSYGGDPVTVEAPYPTVSNPAQIPVTVVPVTVTPRELAELFANAKTEDVTFYLYERDGVLEFEGQYYTFGQDPLRKIALSGFVQALTGLAEEMDTEEAAQAQPPRATADDMTDADVLPRATELEADIHETASVENTNLLIADLEAQNANLKSINDRQAETVTRVLNERAELEDMVRRDIAAFKQVIVKVEDMQDVIAGQRDHIEFHHKQTAELKRMLEHQSEIIGFLDKKYRLGKVIFPQLKNRAEMAEYRLKFMTGSNETLRKRNEKLQATIDYLKRPFYERWAIAVRGFLGSSTDDGGE